MGPLYGPRRFQDTIQFDSPSIFSSDKSVLIFLPVITRRNIGTSPETGSEKGTRSANSQFLFLAISYTQKEQKITSCKRSFYVESIIYYIRKQPFKMETVKSVPQTIQVMTGLSL